MEKLLLSLSSIFEQEPAYSVPKMKLTDELRDVIAKFEARTVSELLQHIVLMESPSR